MKKTCRLLTLTSVMAITASLAVPAFAASEPGDKEGMASFFSTFVGENHSLANPVIEEFAPAPSTEATADGTGAAAPEASAPAAVEADSTPYALGWDWMKFPEESEDTDN